MKKILPILMLFVSLVAMGHNPHDKFDPKRFEVEMQQFITQKAGLTPKEAALFFPLFNEMQCKQRVLFDKMRTYNFVDTSNDKACLKAIKEMDEIDVQLKEIQKEYHLKLCKVLSPSKVYKAIKADEEFHRQAFKRMMNRPPRKK